MRCPVDKQDMIVVEHQKIELDYCLNCSGIWFDTQELELLVESLKKQGAAITAGSVLSPEPASVQESPRRCPICGTKMDKVWMGKDPRVVIDSCHRGHGLWFDGGELHKVLLQMQTAGKTGGQDVISFLGATFMADVEKEAKQ